MAFIGNTNTTQAFTPAVDFFSGNASTTAFTLSRPVASVAQVQAVISNVPQAPGTAFTVSGNTITFTSAPPSGTNNIYVYYTSPITQVIAPGQGTVQTIQLGNITNIASGNSSLTLQTGTTPTTALTINTSQNVGIGTSSPDYALDVTGAIGINTATSNNLTFHNGSGVTYAGIRANTNSNLLFLTGSDLTTGERMRIDSSGNLLLNQTSGNADAKFSVFGGSTDSSPCIDFRKGSATTTTSQVYARFFCNNGSTATGSITANGVSGATFTAYSDRRLKENITDLPSQLANIMALRPVEFDYKGYTNGEGHQIGFIAQEVQHIFPDLVAEDDNGMLTLSDMNKNDARLIKAIQELKSIIDTQASTITQLQADVAALKGAST